MSITTFSKMHGLGNDFIVLDARHTPFDWEPERIMQLAERHTGIGFDQLLLIEPAGRGDADFAYRIFNADGSEVEHCGNGARCFAKYIYDHGLAPRERALRVAICKGIIDIHFAGCSDGIEHYRVNMGAPDFTPFTQAQTDRLYQHIAVEDFSSDFGIVSLGNPHAVTECADVFGQDRLVASVGSALQNHALFPERVNVGFMEIINPCEIKLRVYERGSGETQACGTGACAAVAVGIARGALESEVAVRLRGGQLRINWAGGDSPLYMTGPAQTVYHGRLP